MPFLATIARLSTGGLLLAAVAALTSCRSTKASTIPAAAVAAPATDGLSTAAQFGKALFFDPHLSATGKMSCATCHDPAFAYGPPNDRAVQLGGPDGKSPGTRAVPSLRYKEYTPAYADLLDNPDGQSAPGPGGGFAWDGRANTLAEQARLPLLSPIEMANASPADVVAKVKTASYASHFLQAFPQPADTEAAFKAILAALQAFQIEDPSFHPYSSKFDLHAGNKIGGDLTPAELRGFKVFVNPQIGNCSSCHFHGAGLNGSSGMFTDFSYEAVGVPRNAAIAGAEPDLGLCGPLRTDHPVTAADNRRFCGMFKTPTLRNLSKRKAFFHNGVMHSLEQVIRFYNTRDTLPELWYPTVGGVPKAHNDRGFPGYGLVTRQYLGGVVQKFDDLPAPYRANVDPQMPLDGRARHSKPPMTEQNMADLICFLETLTDDYVPPASPPKSGRCVD
jgi:cytochrome c peroxidase